MNESILTNVNQEKLDATKRMIEKQNQIVLENARMNGTDSELEKLLTIINDKEFPDKLSACDSMEKLRKLFADGGLELSDEQIREMFQGVADCFEKIKKNDGELTEEELEEIAGGWSWKVFGVFGVVAAASFIVGAALSVLPVMAVLGGTYLVAGVITSACSE